MNRNAFIKKESPRQLDEIWEMEEKTEKSKGTWSFTTEEKRVQHNFKVYQNDFLYANQFFQKYSVISFQSISHQPSARWLSVNLNDRRTEWLWYQFVLT